MHPRPPAAVLPSTVPAGVLAAVLVLALAPAPGRAAAAPAQVVIYRCTDNAGRVTLRDTPCRAGSEQQVRSMLRPKDAPVARVPALAAMPASAGQAAPPPRIVVVRAPQPLYECITPEGSRYTSATPDGHPRWVPLWTLGLPVQAGGHDLAITGGSVSLGADGIAVRRPLPAAAWPATAGTWVRDRCHALPQAEVCARLRDDRHEIDRRYFNAQPSERARLRTEKRGLQARLDADCA